MSGCSWGDTLHSCGVFFFSCLGWLCRAGNCPVRISRTDRVNEGGERCVESGGREGDGFMIHFGSTESVFPEGHHRDGLYTS